MNDAVLERCLENYGRYDTDELLRIWSQNDRRAYTEEIFEAIRRILTNRGCEIPPQADYAAQTLQYTFEGSEDFVAFLGGDDEYYLPKFKKFVDRGNRFLFTWNWAAFFFQGGWLLYRKLYLWFAIAFLLSLIPIFGVLFGIVWAMTGNYLYFMKAAKAIKRIRSTVPADSDLTQLIAKRGGVNVWVAIVGAILWVLGTVATFVGR